ncbi:group II intron reverse transcriptase/maturase [Moorena bouillonii]|uniref:Group II intron reverse transcriptase/maturase n=2 Tax=Moorena TaxID=1155738 RepID=A0A1U7N1Y9_9CYAN|nr:group II intron reverse transcriptase/maturase [Moorena bouillonii]OLT59963.1 group II intron reverse transcriptase/maturase [Moorena bouillonii PNG]
MNKSKTKGFSQKAEWNSTNWRKLEIVLFKLQKRIYRASQRGDVKAVKRLQKTLMSSWTARMLAVRKVTQQNKGKKSAGVDGRKALTAHRRIQLVKNLNIGTRPDPTRRVWIDKPGKSEKRPLGIPTIEDRAIQALVKMALEPEWEAKFEPNSYGFRPGRNAFDAREAIFNGLKTPKWVLDADISKCFDKINHSKLLNKLDTFPKLRRIVKGWLKAGVIDKGTFAKTETGTPQGGVISPLLANIALHGMEEEMKSFAETYVEKRKSKTQKRRGLIFVRYADDFVVMHKSKEHIEKCKDVINEWLNDIGLELKPEKTQIVHSNDGFDFLGFNVRQYEVGKNQSKLGYKTLIKPSKKAIKEHWEDLCKLIDSHKAAPQEHLINKLNQKIRGWCNYHKTGISKEIFGDLDHLMYQKLRRWGKYRHGNKSWDWVKKKYWGRVTRKDGEHGNDNWVFRKSDEQHLIKHAWIEVSRYVKVKQDRSIYDGDLTYWGNRMSKHPELVTQKGKLFKKQKGKCAHCGLTFRTGDDWEVHHVKPLSQGGKDQIQNMELIHLHCHDEIHREIRKHQNNIRSLDENPI